MPKKTIKQDVTEDPRYHDTWRLLKKYRDVVWSMELSVQQMKNQFQIEYGSSIEDFLDSVYLAGADLSGTDLEDHARCIERSNKMLTLVNNSIELLRTRHKHGEDYYWLLYYTYLSPPTAQKCGGDHRTASSPHPGHQPAHLLPQAEAGGGGVKFCPLGVYFKGVPGYSGTVFPKRRVKFAGI